MLLDQGENDFPDYARRTTSLVLKLDGYGGLYIGENEADWLLAHGADKRHLVLLTLSPF